jgi:uncharacterized SAM-binding protein YcdF (DUF218 family)
MLIFNKLLPILVLPLGWVVALLLYALLRKRRWPIIAAVVVLYVASMPLVGDRLMRWLESAYPPCPLADVAPADAIVPLGGILGPQSVAGLLPNVGEAGERLESGIELWQRQKAPWLVFTGGRLPWAPHFEIEGARSARLAVARGIPTEKVVLTSVVGNTADEARVVASLMRERGWKKIILVTSAWHMRRAARQFRKAGVDFVPFPVDYQIDRGARITVLDFLPQASGLRQTEAALREWYGIAFYAVFGRG